MNRHDGTFTGVLLLVLSGLADTVVGLPMRPVLKRCAPVRSLGYLILRVAECLAVVAGVYFLTGRSQWNDYVLPVYALSGAAGLLLASALLTSRLVPRSLSVLGNVGYAALLLGVVCDLLGIADLAPASGAGMAFLVPGGLFELAFPLMLIVRGSSGRTDARLMPVSAGGAG